MFRKYNKGYIIIVESAEGDADNRTTVEFQTNNKNVMEYLREAATHLYSSDIANLYEPGYGELELVCAYAKQLFYKHLVGVCDIPETDEEHIETFMEYMHSVGLSTSGDFYTRYTTSVKVLYTPTDVYFEEIL